MAIVISYTNIVTPMLVNMYIIFVFINLYLCGLYSGYNYVDKADLLCVGNYHWFSDILVLIIDRNKTK